MTVEELDLVSYARDAAALLFAQCPYVVFTSGRRDWYEQAHAMARNQIKAQMQGNPQWVGGTYRHEPQFQAWFDEHQHESLEVTTDAFFRIALALPEELQARFAHPAGRAFDCQHAEIPDHQREIETAIGKLPHLEFWTPNEGGILVNHAQFSLARAV